MKRIVVPVALVALSVLLTCGAAELVVRALWKDQTVMFPRYHTDYRYGAYTLRGIRPHSEFWHSSADGRWRFVTNGKGFRDTREFGYEKPAGTLRVLALGDSHTQGYEVRQEATFSAVLERYLAAHGVKAEVLNAGVSGYSTAEALAFLENEGYKYQPDVVVLGFYANDLEDNLKAGLFALEDGKLVEKKRSHVPGVRIQNLIYGVPGVQWLSENSYLYSVLFNGIWNYFKAAKRDQAADEVEYAIATRTSHSDYEVQLAVALVERMQKFCDERGTRLMVIDIPRLTDRYHFAESISPDALRKVDLLSSRALFTGFSGAAELHVPRGHTHISELSHALIGVAVGRRILEK
jgi:lysophospholipase L1-like esterase